MLRHRHVAIVNWAKNAIISHVESSERKRSERKAKQRRWAWCMRERRGVERESDERERLFYATKSVVWAMAQRRQWRESGGDPRERKSLRERCYARKRAIILLLYDWLINRCILLWRAADATRCFLFAVAATTIATMPARFIISLSFTVYHIADNTPPRRIRRYTPQRLISRRCLAGVMIFCDPIMIWTTMYDVVAT